MLRSLARPIRSKQFAGRKLSEERRRCDGQASKPASKPSNNYESHASVRLESQASETRETSLGVTEEARAKARVNALAIALMGIMLNAVTTSNITGKVKEMVKPV